MNKFNSKYPLIAAPMNKVSDLNFAIVCFNAGIVPSISAFNYYNVNFKNRVDFKRFEEDLSYYKTVTQSGPLFLSIEIETLMCDEFLPIIKLSAFSCVEIIDKNEYFKDPLTQRDKFLAFKNRLEICKNKNIFIFFKVLDPKGWLERSDIFKSCFDGCVFKSVEASGSVILSDNRKSIYDEFLEIQDNDPSKIIVPSGGISTREQIFKLLELGASIVSIGSYFSVAEESCLSKETKLKIINSNRSNLSTFNNTHNALIFSNIIEDDYNHTESLKLGIKDPNQGHVFMGASIDHITEILPLKDLVSKLIQI
jgi:hypothetical protein